MTARPFAAATERNASPILAVLRKEFAKAVRILEIGSGTGQHAVRFGRELGHLTWQTSDLEENHPGIRAWIDEARVANVLAPLALDVRDASLPPRSYDGVFTANTAHIMSLSSVQRMFALAGHVLEELGVFCLYGPVRRNGEFNTESNAAFHRSLKLQDPAMGIRDLEDLDGFGRDHGLRRRRLYSMPANNSLAVWEKQVRSGT